MGDESTFDEIFDQAGERLTKIQSTWQQICRTRIREESEDGVVAVEVDGNGRIAGIWFADAVSAMRGKELAELVVQTAARAAKAAAQCKAQIFEDLKGDY